MAEFDPTPLLNDPNFVTDFVIRRYTRTKDNHGRVQTTSRDIPARGVVVPSGALGMVRTANVEQQGSGILVFTEEPISTGDASIQQPADDIIFHGQLYQVQSQDDYSDFNYNVASATLQEPGGRAVA